MTRSSPADIITYLNTNWVILTISKPTFVDQFENEAIKVPHSLGVNWVGMDWVEMTTGFSSKDEETNTLPIHIAEGTIADLNIMIDHVRELMKVKPLAGGHYQITSGTPIKMGSIYQCFLTLIEVMSLK